MGRKLGITLLDLFGISDRTSSALPSQVTQFVEKFALIEYRSTRSAGAFYHYGAIQALSSSFSDIPNEFDLGFGKLRLPLVNAGIPFQMAFSRQTISADLEPVADTWRLDLFLDQFVLILNDLKPAILVPESGTTPRHLLPDKKRSDTMIKGSAVLRIEKPDPDGSVGVRLIDTPDPLDPLANTGFVARVSVSPPHFFFGNSDYGMTIGEILYDGSEGYTPAAIVERGHDAGWQGLSIKEATFYAPRNLPGIGDLSAGIKNFLIGDPIGIQGELEIQFGRTALSPSTFQFEQVRNGSTTSLTVTGSERVRFVEITASLDGNAEILAGLTSSGPPVDIGDGVLQDWKAEWRWPNGSREIGDRSSGTVQHAQILTVVPIEVLTNGTEKTEIRHPEITVAFVASGTAPVISANIGSQNFSNVVHIGGIRGEIEAITLTATSTSSSPSEINWSIHGRNEKHTGTTYSPSLSGLTGHQFIVIEEKITEGDHEEKRYTRIRVEIRDKGVLLIGTENGVFKSTDNTTAQQISAVEYSYDLSDFHARGDLNTASSDATRTTTSPFVSVPSDVIAQVVIAPPTPSPSLPTDRHLQLLFEFDRDQEADINYMRKLAPGGQDEFIGSSTRNEAYSQVALLDWAANYPGAQFIVIGRCGDRGSASYNRDLAVRRATTVVNLLTTFAGNNPEVLIVPASAVFYRGEQSEWIADATTADGLEDDVTLQLMTGEKSDAITDAGLFNGWLIKQEHPEHTSWPTNGERVAGSPDENARVEYRRVDIYACGGVPVMDTMIPDDNVTLDPNLRRSMVPNNNRDVAPAPPGTPKIDYRVKFRVVWDSPTAVDWGDAIPSLAEFEFAWTPNEQPLAPVGGKPVDVSREVLTFLGQWVHDAKTGYTKLSVGLSSEGDKDGLFSISNLQLTAALAFGPALLSGVDLDNDMLGGGARIAALAALIGFADSLFKSESKTAVKSVTIETELRALTADAFKQASQYRALLDYISTLHVDVDLSIVGLKTKSDKPAKIRYKKVGLEFDTTQSGFDQLGLVYDSTSMEIVDSGKWEITGILGELLRITEIAMGRGSIWIESSIAIALEIGIIEISEATFRITFKDGETTPDFEIRGFKLKVDVPGAIKGEGRLRIENGGVIRAGVDCKIVPLELSANAALALAKQTDPEPYVFLSLSVGVQFSTPLPLAQSGAAIYGFKGLFAMNGDRKLGTSQDPIAKELEWFAAKPENKYKAELGQYALGVGVVVGTLPDVSFCFSAEGMLVVGFPDPEVIIGVKVKVLEIPNTKVKDQNTSEATITGLIVIDRYAVKVGVSAQYKIPKILELKIPFSAYFPYPGTGEDVYVRIGSDGVTSITKPRYGESITLKLLPGILDIKAWAFLMIEEGGIEKLGDDSRFNFNGFSVGFGAGAGVKWSAGPIVLRASIKTLVGFGTKPLILKGGVFVEGELSLIVISISARGSLILEFREVEGASEPKVQLDGEFCGKVDFFFFSIEGCVDVHFGNSVDITPPEPPSPVGGISLTDRRDQIMGTMTSGSSIQSNPILEPPGEDGSTEPAKENNVVWPDTSPVIHFSHFIEQALPSSCPFQPTPPSSSEKWFGSSELKYAYRLDDIILRRKLGDGTLVIESGDLQSVWTTSPYRQPVPDGGDGPEHSEHEGFNLKLLDWNPWAWVTNIDNGGEGQPGDPVTTIDNLCDPALPAPKPLCLYGKDARRNGPLAVRIRPEVWPTGTYASRFDLLGHAYLKSGSAELTGRNLQTLIELAGGTIEQGEVITIPQPWVNPRSTKTLNEGYRLPRVLLPRETGLAVFPLFFKASYTEQVVQPNVTLMLCAAGHGETGDMPQTPDTECADFLGIKPQTKEFTSFGHQGLIFESLDRNHPFFLKDAVKQTDRVAIPGKDGHAEVHFPTSGIRIKLPETVAWAELTVMLHNRQPVEARALDADGRVIASDSVAQPENQALTLTLVGDHFDVIELRGGASEAQLFKVCYQTTRTATIIDSTQVLSHAFMTPRLNLTTAPTAFNANAQIPVVLGLEDDGKEYTWEAQIVAQVKTGQRYCYIITYTPKDGKLWDGFRILSPANRDVTLLSTCAIEQAVIDERNDDAAVAEGLEDAVADAAATPPDERRAIILEPDAEYELEVRWSYQAWVKDDDNETPPSTSSGTWINGTTDVYRFRTAADDSSLVNAPQDGLNEFKFDARDISRYVKAVQPVDAVQPHFLDDPLWMHFEIGYVKQLLAVYDRDLKVEIRRSDPPPQPGANITSLIQPLPIILSLYNLARDYQPTGYARINDAILAAPCLPDAGPLGGTSVAAEVILEPDANYDFILTSSKSDGTQRMEVHKTRFQTSRYASPEMLLRSQGYETGSTPPPPEDFLLEDDFTGWGNMTFVESDTELANTLALADADVLPLPGKTSTSTVFWYFNETTSQWEIRGLLVDSLETMNRDHYMLDAANNPVLEKRFLLQHATVAGSHTLSPIRANTTWTRVLLAPAAPIVLAPDAETELALVCQTGSTTLTGRRRLTGLPSIILMEGL